MKKILNFFALMYAMLFSRFAYADVATVAATASGGVPFDEAVRVVYSKEIEFKALPNMRFYQFATIKEELGVEPGNTISMLTYDNLVMGGQLTEMVNMSTQAMSGSLKQISVTEYGNAVSVTEKLLQASFEDLLDRATTLLGRDYALVLDCELRDVAVDNTNVVYASKADGTVVTTRAGLTTDCILKVGTIQAALEILETNNAPKALDGESWICFLHPHQVHGIRRDPDWISAANYGDPQRRFSGEVGRIDDTRFISTTLMPNGAAPTTNPAYDADLKKGAAGGSANTNVYTAVIFGDAYYGMAVSLPVELRDNGVEDFGRKRSLAWYAIFGVGMLHEEYGVRIETA